MAGSSKSLKLVVPSVTGQYKPVHDSDVPAFAEAADITPSRKHLSVPTSGTLQRAHTSKSFSAAIELYLNRHVTEQELPDKRHSPHCIQHHMTAGDAGIAVTAAIDGTRRPGTGYGAGQGSGGQSDAHDLRCLVATQQSEVYFELLQSTQKCMCCNNRALHAISLPYLGDCLAYK